MKTEKPLLINGMDESVLLHYYVSNFKKRNLKLFRYKQLSKHKRPQNNFIECNVYQKPISIRMAAIALIDDHKLIRLIKRNREN